MKTDFEDIKPGTLDEGGREILQVYFLVYSEYAVYRTLERVLVKYSFDPEVCIRQRKLLFRLAPLRHQINGLVVDWRASHDTESRSRAATFDGRVAAALNVALEGDAGAALKLLSKVYADILQERAAAASVSYVMWAAAATAAAVFIACFFTSPLYRRVFEFSPDAYALWLGVGVGALGAFFSIAVAARSRKILTNAQGRRENRMDAIVRVTIGSIAGMLLAGLLRAKLVSFTIAGVESAEQSSGWMLLAFGAFVAGFSERLIPNLLDSSSSAASGQAAAAAHVDAVLPTPDEIHDSDLTVSRSEMLDWPRIESDIASDLGLTRANSGGPVRSHSRSRLRNRKGATGEPTATARPSSLQSKDEEG